MAFIPRILGQHAEEASLLWLRRNHAVSQPQFRLADLVRLDEKLEAHLEGLRIAEADTKGAAWSTCRELVEQGGAGDVFPVAILALESGDAGRMSYALDACAKSHGQARAFVSAMGWLPWNTVAKAIEQLVPARDSNARRIGIAAYAIHRRDPGPLLREAIADSELPVRTRALRAVGELGRRDLLPLARIGLSSRNQQGRFAAAWSIARFEAFDDALVELGKTAESQSPDSERALLMLLRRLEPRAALHWLKRLAENPQTRRKAVIGAGILGLPESIPWLLEMMDSADLARVAGEAVSMITGVEIAADLAGQPPEGFAAGPTDEPQDENVEMDADENLPWPKRRGLSEWWSQHQGDFHQGTRCLAGQPINNERWLQQLLISGYQRQRTAAALELAIRHPELPLFETRAPGFRQLQILSPG